jgi:Asp-tRNA(Asn)/Glu-tRNA(Gln) amidotransferase A subunit family amidase
VSRPAAYASGAGRTPSFRSAAAAFRDGTLTPRAYLDALIERIEETEGEVHAFVTLDLESARSAADASSARYAAGRPASPVDGLPIGLKDIIQTRALPTQSGSPIFEGWMAERDAPVAAALARGGAVIVGKTATTEFAYGAITPTRNPYDLERTPGTSSSGSAAAVGAGMLPAAIGTQLMSSVMRPASYCGHIGVKPTYGAIRQDAIHPFSPSGEHVGVHAHALDDAWTLLRFLSHEAGPIPGERGIEGPETPPEPVLPRRLMRMYTPGWELAEAGVRTAFENAVAMLKDAGVEIVEPDSNLALSALETDFARADWCIAEIAAFEMRWPFFEYEAAGGAFHDRISNLLARAHEVTLEDYHAALDWKHAARRRYLETAGTIDGMIGLTAPETAPVGLENIGHPVNCSPASCIGAPAISLPLMQADGLPLGLQIVGFHNRDADMFGYAAGIDGVLGT